MTPAAAFDGWALDPGTLGFHVPFAEYVAVAAAAGYDAVEVPVAELTALGPKQLAELCARHGVRAGIFSCPWSGPYNGSVPDEVFEQRLRDIPRVFALVAEAGGTRVSAFFNGRRPGMDVLTRDRLADRAGRLAAQAARHGLRMCLELNDTDHLAAAAEILLTARRVTGHRPQLLVDTFHLYRAGLGTEWLDALPSDAIGWVHVSGVPDGTPRSADSGPRTAPFRGTQPTADLLTAVHRAGYRGPLSIEVLPAPEPGTGLHAHAAGLLETARRGLPRVRTAPERAGAVSGPDRTGGAR
ncbi:sugar phosphate isomerase/epimerase [Streptomyces sp. Ag109_O5-1]|uniref:sugar phosphate isomerase/epimerase family protein n=1 Tax=Streptomyces sp. Ag109_O5-1 TaxID=1938851 RepID=UPI000F5077FD|nr:sugar phosphate isomerase/epimerase family protein [Streptomyces sp. Ag109_O5-1]RPE39965.1 sugar phosphate isomerase/epimerase [Streptomyces sp. Ag109_O5-1]